MAQALDAEDMLRNLPAPEINYHLEGIRVLPATGRVLATEPVPLPPEKPPYEARKLVEKIKAIETAPMVRSARKLIGNLATARAKSEIREAQPASATHQVSASASQTIRAARPAPVVASSSTRIIAAVRVLATNSAVEALRARIASDSALAKDIFTLYVETVNPDSQPEGEAGQAEVKPGKFDSILVTATGLQKKKDWQGLKDLFTDNPDAGETTDGLRFQIEAELNSPKPNYMSAQRFANQVIEREANDPLANYALAMYFYNSKKPNPERAKKALEIAMKAKIPPEGASALYWTMLAKKMLLPIILLFAGLVAGISQFIKKRKAARFNILANEPLIPAAEATKVEPVMTALPDAQGFKAKLLALKEKLLSKIPFGKKSQSAGPGIALASQTTSESTAGAALAEPAPAATETNPAQRPEPVTAPPEKRPVDSEEGDDELFELEGEDSELIEGATDEDTLDGQATAAGDADNI